MMGLAAVYTQDISFRNVTCYTLNFLCSITNVVRMIGLSSGSKAVARSLRSFKAIFSAIFVFRYL
jgi:hypothetical protein